MNRWLAISILIFSIIAALWTPRAMAISNCTEPIPEIFERVAPSVVFISTVTIDPYKMINRVSGVIGSGFIISDDNCLSRRLVLSSPEASLSVVFQ